MNLSENDTFWSSYIDNGGNYNKYKGDYLKP